MTSKNTYTLINPQTGNLAFKFFLFDDNNSFDHVRRLNYYTLIWIEEGEGMLKSDFSEYRFSSNQVLAFAPYQPFMLKPEGAVSGKVIHFHPDFFCIHKHHQEVACNGVLFNNIYASPIVLLTEALQKTMETVFEQIRSEIQDVALAQYELLVAYLKIILISASRQKKIQHQENSETENADAPFILQNLKNYIELHFKTKHAPSDYAELLNITPNALAKITKNHFNKTLSHLITERIMIEAKRELYLTNKPVKEIAYELGYDDEHYFSRFFKNNADVSPQLYRETIGFAKGN